MAVQQKLMRHADIRTTMNIYADVVTDEMPQAHERVVEFADPPKRIVVDRKARYHSPIGYANSAWIREF